MCVCVAILYCAYVCNIDQHTHTYTHTHTHIHTHINTHTYIHAHTQRPSQTFPANIQFTSELFTRLPVGASDQSKGLILHLIDQVCVCVCVCVCTSFSLHAHTHTHTHTHTHIHTYIPMADFDAETQ